MLPEIREQDVELSSDLTTKYALHPILARVLSSRNRKYPSETLLRASPDLSSLKGVSPARSLADFLSLPVVARKNESSILFYGDYDVDGILSTYILFRLCQHFGIKCNYFLPSRFNEGYGLSERIVKQASEQGYDVLFALDCGTTNFAEVALAKELGMEVFILDHHVPAETVAKGSIPDARIINPHLEEGVSPLCTTGLAYLLAKVWLEETNEGDSLLRENFLEFPAIATIADVVPLVGDNFLLCHFGWKRILETKNIGLRKLLELCSLAEASLLTYKDVAFTLGPLLNSPGRMAHARFALELLLSRTLEEAKTIAETIMKLNRSRREQQDRLFFEALRQAEGYADAQILVLYSKDWNQGLTGIISARIAETHNKPTLILSDSSGNPEQAAFSGRAPRGVNLLQSLEPARLLFTKLGGHSQAVGGSIRLNLIDKLRKALWDADVIMKETNEYVIPVDTPCDAQELSSLEPSDLMRVYPFGDSYPPPRVLLKSVKLTKKNLAGFDSTHLLLQVTDESSATDLKLVGFKRSHLEPSLKVGEIYDFALEVELDNFRGRLGILLRLLEAYPSKL